MSHKFLAFLKEPFAKEMMSYLNNFEEFAFKVRAEEILDIFLQLGDPDIFCKLTYQLSIFLKQWHF